MNNKTKILTVLFILATTITGVSAQTINMPTDSVSCPQCFSGPAGYVFNANQQLSGLEVEFYDEMPSSTGNLVINAQGGTVSVASETVSTDTSTHTIEGDMGTEYAYAVYYNATDSTNSSNCLSSNVSYPTGNEYASLVAGFNGWGGTTQDSAYNFKSVTPITAENATPTTINEVGSIPEPIVGTNEFRVYANVSNPDEVASAEVQVAGNTVYSENMTYNGESGLFETDETFNVNNSDPQGLHSSNGSIEAIALITNDAGSEFSKNVQIPYVNESDDDPVEPEPPEDDNETTEEPTNDYNEEESDNSLFELLLGFIGISLMGIVAKSYAESS